MLGVCCSLQLSRYSYQWGGLVYNAQLHYTGTQSQLRGERRSKGRDDFLCIRSPLIKTSKVIQGRTRRGSPALLHVTVRGQAPALLIAWKPSSSQKGVPLGPGSVGRLWAGTACCGLSALTLILAVLFGHLVWNMTKHIIYPYWGYTIWPIDSISSWNQKLVID